MAVLATAGTAHAQEFEIYTGKPDAGVPAIARKPANHLAKCLADPGDAISCTIAQSEGNDGGLESGTMNAVGYVACADRRGVCLEAASFDPNEPQKPRLASVDVRILFDYDKATIRAGEEQKLRALAAAMQDEAAERTRFAIIGHTDAKGSDTYNCRLSRARGTSVHSRLIALGVAESRLRVIAAGEYVLRNAKQPEAAENRRVGFAPLGAPPASQGGEVMERLAGLCAGVSRDATKGADPR